MNRWWGDSSASAKQASERDQRAARRVIARLPTVAQSGDPLSDDNEVFDDCNQSFSALNLDGNGDLETASTSSSSGAGAPGGAAAPGGVPAVVEPDLPIMAATFDTEDKENDSEAWKKEVKIKFQPHDVEYWFNTVEAQMKKFGINRQWDKKDAIVPLLPDDVVEECKPILRLSQTDAGDQVYKNLKDEILSLYGSRDEDAFKQALALKLTGKPSALGKKLIHLICPGAKPMTDCHCARIIYGFWNEQMPSSIRTKLAGRKFNKDTYQELFKLADETFIANGGQSRPPAVIVAVAAASAEAQSEDPPQVAAVQRGGGRGGRGNRGAGARGGRGGQSNRGQNRNTYNNNNSNSNQGTQNQHQNQHQNSSNQKPHQKGQKHPDLPSNASWACAQHWKKGRGAPYCSDPTVCQWNNIYVARQNQ